MHWVDMAAVHLFHQVPALYLLNQVHAGVQVGHLQTSVSQSVTPFPATWD